MHETTGIDYIDHPHALAALADALRGTPWVALDTEFQRERCYYPRLCLLQVATPSRVACVDTIALAELEPLLEVLFDPATTVVLHAARQDLEILYHLRQAVPIPLFDTQVAAPLLGYPDQVGYGSLVQEVLSVQLGKHHTRADWSQRPLTAAQLRYAADDVIYLGQLYQRLHEALAARGRLGWLEEEMAVFAEPALYEPAPELAWQRIRGAERLRGASLAALQRLAAWRERTAQEADRPRNWLLRDEALVDMARLLPNRMDGLKRIRGLSERAIQRHGQAWLASIKAAKAAPRPPADDGCHKRLSPEQEALADALMALVKVRSAEHTLSAGILASRKELERLVRGEQDLPVLGGWRRQVVGEDLLALVRGELQLTGDGGRLVVAATRA